MIDLNESQLRSCLQTVAPDLYHAAYTGQPIYLTLVNAKGDNIGGEPSPAYPRIVAGDRRIELVFVGEEWYLFRAKKKATDVAITISLKPDSVPLHKFYLSRQGIHQVRKRDFLHVHNLKIVVGDV